MMNPRSPYAQLVQQQRQDAAAQQGQMGAPPPQPQAQVQARPMQYEPKPSQEPQKKDGGIMSMMGSAGSMMSDERSKKEIARLESANSALSKALSSRAVYPDTGNSSPGLQALGQQNKGGGRRPGDSDQDFANRDPEGFNDWADARGWSKDPVPPSQANFPDAPDSPANQVAAQNVGMQQQAGAAAPQQAQGGGFGFRPGMPDMSALDEAYARMGRGG